MTPELQRHIEEATCKICLGNGRLAGRQTINNQHVDVSRVCEPCKGTGRADAQST